MSYVFPPNRDRTKWPIDPDSLNENFQEVLSEVQGNLGEHNWQEDGIPNTKIKISEEEAPIVCWSRFINRTPWDEPSIALNPQTTSTYGWKVPNSRDWSTIGFDLGGDEFSKRLTTRNGMLWIMASFQQHGRWDNWAAGGNSMPGVQYAIAVDGSIIHETIPGCLDYGNDPLGAAVAVRRYPFAIDVLFPIFAGDHKIEVKCRLAMGDSVKAFDPDTDFYMISHREFIIIEMR